MAFPLCDRYLVIKCSDCVSIDSRQWAEEQRRKAHWPAEPTMGDVAHQVFIGWRQRSTSWMWGDTHCVWRTCLCIDVMGVPTRWWTMKFWQIMRLLKYWHISRQFHRHEGRSEEERFGKGLIGTVVSWNGRIKCQEMSFCSWTDVNHSFRRFPSIPVEFWRYLFYLGPVWGSEQNSRARHSICLNSLSSSRRHVSNASFSCYSACGYEKRKHFQWGCFMTPSSSNVTVGNCSCGMWIHSMNTSRQWHMNQLISWTVELAESWPALGDWCGNWSLITQWPILCGWLCRCWATRFGNWKQMDCTFNHFSYRTRNGLLRNWNEKSDHNSASRSNLQWNNSCPHGNE